VVSLDAGNTIKILLSELLMHYEIDLDPKAPEPSLDSMPNATFFRVRNLFRRCAVS
jgi:hypothetical protein